MLATVAALVAMTVVLLVAAHRSENRIMSKLDDLTAALDAETNALAAKLDSLKAELAAAQGGAVTDAQLAALQSVSDRLKSLGADPAAPIPAPVTPTSPAPATPPATPTP